MKKILILTLLIGSLGALAQSGTEQPAPAQTDPDLEYRDRALASFLPMMQGCMDQCADTAFTLRALDYKGIEKGLKRFRASRDTLLWFPSTKARLPEFEANAKTLETLAAKARRIAEAQDLLEKPLNKNEVDAALDQLQTLGADKGIPAADRQYCDSLTTLLLKDWKMSNHLAQFLDYVYGEFKCLPEQSEAAECKQMLIDQVLHDYYPGAEAFPSEFEQLSKVFSHTVNALDNYSKYQKTVGTPEAFKRWCLDQKSQLVTP